MRASALPMLMLLARRHDAVAISPLSPQRADDATICCARYVALMPFLRSRYARCYATRLIADMPRFVYAAAARAYALLSIMRRRLCRLYAHIRALMLMPAAIFRFATP